MDDGTVVDTANASAAWEEERDWDGSNHISRPTGSQWRHERLHRSRRGRYYLEQWSQTQGSRARAEWISDRRAAAWLLLNDHPVPADLAEAAEDVAE
jgi:hypothetical protein